MWGKHIFVLKCSCAEDFAVGISEWKFACSDHSGFPPNFLSLKHDKYQKSPILLQIDNCQLTWLPQVH